MKKIFLTIIAATLFIGAAAQELTILHLNDTHSHIDPQRSGKNKGYGGVIEQAAYIDQVRAEEGKKNVLLVHAGDFSQGTSYFSELGGDIEIDVMNAAGYDVITLGNHEFDNGVPELARRLRSLEADVVCANYDFTGTVLEKLVKPYVIIRRAGLKIGVIGLLTDVSRVVEADLIKGLEYKEPSSVVNPIAEYLVEKKNCDLVICLSHLGFREDIELAGNIRNVDLIVGGHSHTLPDEIHEEEDLDGNTVRIVQDGKWGLNVGRLSIDF